MVVKLYFSAKEQPDHLQKRGGRCSTYMARQGFLKVPGWRAPCLVVVSIFVTTSSSSWSPPVFVCFLFVLLEVSLITIKCIFTF